MSNYKNRVWILRLFMALVFVIAPAFCFAQGDPPADGCDPFDGCAVPLDTWVILLFTASLAYGFYHLNMQQHAAKTSIMR